MIATSREKLPDQIRSVVGAAGATHVRLTLSADAALAFARDLEWCASIGNRRYVAEVEGFVK